MLNVYVKFIKKYDDDDNKKMIWHLLCKQKSILDKKLVFFL